MGVAALLGWMVAITALLAWFRSLRRLRLTVNRGIHELRRPLQQAFLLSTSSSGDHAVPEAMERTLAALDDLDADANDRPLPSRVRPVDVRRVVEGCIEQRQGITPFEQPHVRWNAQTSQVLGDPDRLRRIFDNLIENAEMHGSAPVWVRADGDSRSLRVAVGNAAGATNRVKPGPSRGQRRGYGLGIVRQLVCEHGGRLHCRHLTAGYEAIVELPLSGT